MAIIYIIDPAVLFLTEHFKMSSVKRSFNLIHSETTQKQEWSEGDRVIKNQVSNITQKATPDVTWRHKRNFTDEAHKANTTVKSKIWTRLSWSHVHDQHSRTALCGIKFRQSLAFHTVQVLYRVISERFNVTPFVSCIVSGAKNITKKGLWLLYYFSKPVVLKYSDTVAKDALHYSKKATCDGLRMLGTIQKYHTNK